MKTLRRCAILHNFSQTTTLEAALEHFAFVQADPIRSPARAQDLILRHRVKNYRAGDLEKHYPKLNLEEDFLYAYGFMPRNTWQLLHPRTQGKLSKFEKQILEIVQTSGPMHPKVLEKQLGKKSVRNNWGGFSQAGTQALEVLQHRGLLRVARRENGIRVYEQATLFEEKLSKEQRLRALILLVANILAPVSQRTLRAQMQRYKRLGNPQVALEALLKSGELRQENCDGVSYLWPNVQVEDGELVKTVKLLAPFDPLVWDRARFEHFWGWQYRFEAYTPKAKRVRGYYAMPLLYGEEMIGWANVSTAHDKFEVQIGFVGKEPKEKTFQHELEEEIQRMKVFLALPPKPR